MDKDQKKARQHQEDSALNRGLLWVAGAIVLEFLLLMVNKYYINFRVTDSGIAAAEAIMHILRAARWVGLAGAAACLVWAGLRLRKESGGLSLPVALAAACGAAAVCGYVVITFNAAGVRMLFILVPAWAGLALIYYLYQREFFLAGIAAGFAAVGLWLVRTSGGRLLYTALTVIALILVAVLALALEKKGGAVVLAGREMQLLPRKANYLLVYVTCIGGIVAVAAAQFAGAAVAYYLMYAAVAWVFALLVYYTVKMM